MQAVSRLGLVLVVHVGNAIDPSISLQAASCLDPPVLVAGAKSQSSVPLVDFVAFGSFTLLQDCCKTGRLVSAFDFVKLNFFLFLRGAGLEKGISAYGSTSLGLPLAAMAVGNFETLPPVQGICKSGSIPSVAAVASLGFSLLVQHSCYIGAFTSLLRRVCSDFFSMATSTASLGLSPVVRSFVYLTSLPTLDPAKVDLLLLLHSSLYTGSSTSIKGIDQLREVSGVEDAVLLGAPLSLRSFCCVDFPLFACHLERLNLTSLLQSFG